jgi:DNA-binding NarL/FixJ family response regulator
MYTPSRNEQASRLGIFNKCWTKQLFSDFRVRIGLHRGPMTTSSIRVLVVDDFEPFRRFVCSTLAQIPDLQVIGEVSDGLEAVRKAQELQPDVILMDLGLPTLNGIEAARRIRGLSPESKILFLSENRSWDIAEEALSTGARGYVVKSDAGSELLPAVEAVLHGEKFVSASLSDSDLSNPKDEHAADHPHGKEPIEPLPPEKVASRHEVASTQTMQPSWRDLLGLRKPF